MSRVLIAVGGTGQEIALACLRLCHMAGIEPPLIVIVDSDQGTGRRDPPTRTDELQRFKVFFKQTWGQEFVDFVTPFAQNVPGRPLKTLRGLFSPAGETPPLIQDLLFLLFSPSQQGTGISDGFHGKPTVGSVAVADYMEETEFKQQFLDRLSTLTEPKSPHFIVLAGSTTGGTGPGTIPPLSEKLMAWRKGLNPPRNIQISGVVQLEWFQGCATNLWVRIDLPFFLLYCLNAVQAVRQ
ncbi:MAG: hypothetical protein HY665_05900 [Chloroflexi bacterium]|nr:hypothetical protein [Chloroflexota bacterium]